MIPLPSDTFIERSLKLAKLSQLAYDAEELDPNLPYLKAFEFLGAKGIIADDSETLVIAIAGTDDKHDAVLDMLATPKRLDQAAHTASHSGLESHYGFLHYALNVRTALEGKLYNNGRKVYITGHSLGGAAAILLPLLVPISDPTVVTFGGPRVFTTETAAHYPTAWNVFRWVNELDAVPTFPRFKFDHIGRVRYMSKSGGLSNSRKAFAWFRRLGYYFRRLGIIQKRIDSHHSIAKYIERLEQLTLDLSD